MKIERPNAPASSLKELQDLEKLKALIERAVADGILTKQEMESIKSAISADGKVTYEEISLCRKLIWDKIDNGELEYCW